MKSTNSSMIQAVVWNRVRLFRCSKTKNITIWSISMNSTKSKSKRKKNFENHKTKKTEWRKQKKKQSTLQSEIFRISNLLNETSKHESNELKNRLRTSRKRKRTNLHFSLHEIAKIVKYETKTKQKESFDQSRLFHKSYLFRTTRKAMTTSIIFI